MGTSATVTPGHVCCDRSARDELPAPASAGHRARSECVQKTGDNTSSYGANGGTVPQSLITQQGYLYRDYFAAFRALKGKLDAVTFWAMADDNTWLDSFPINRLDLALPFDTRLQAKPAYWGIVDPSK